MIFDETELKNLCVEFNIDLTESDTNRPQLNGDNLSPDDIEAILREYKLPSFNELLQEFRRPSSNLEQLRKVIYGNT